jgi:hypothetical protein
VATRNFLEALARMPAEIEREGGVAWHEHAGAHEMLAEAIQAELDELKPKGSTAFGYRPHATVFEDDPRKLGAMIAFRLRRDPNFTGSPTRALLEEEHQRAKLTKDLAEHAARQRRRGIPVSLINEPPQQDKKDKGQQKPDQPKRKR